MKNKIIFLFSMLFFLFILFVFSSSVSAFSYTYIYEDTNGDKIFKDYDLGDIELKDYYAICVNYSSSNPNLYNIYLVTCDDEPYFYIDSLKFPSEYIEYRFGSLTSSVSSSVCLSSRFVTFSRPEMPSSWGYYPLASNFDVKYQNGDIFFESTSKLSLNLTVEPNEETSNVPVLITSNWYYLDDWNTSLEVFTDSQEYDVYIHIPQVDNPIGIDDAVCSLELQKDEKDRYMYRYMYKVYKNGTYRFKLTDINGLANSAVGDDYSKYIIEQTIEIDNIVATQDTVDNYVDGRFSPTPFLAYEYVSDTEIYITTQKFFMHELIDLQCYYAKDIDIKKDFNDVSKWTKVDTRTFKDEISQDDVYQFYFSVKNDTFEGNGTYYVKFYNVFLDKWTWSSIDIDFDKILAVDGSWLFKYVSFFRERFGFLVYPFDLAINVLNKVKNIQFEEPAFDIPQVNEPFTHQKLISATHFSFNNLLENEVFNNIHNIYLVVVDVIIVFALVNLLRHKIMGVFEK